MVHLGVGHAAEVPCGVGHERLVQEGYIVFVGACYALAQGAGLSVVVQLFDFGIGYGRGRVDFEQRLRVAAAMGGQLRYLFGRWREDIVG